MRQVRSCIASYFNRWVWKLCFCFSIFFFCFDFVVVNLLFVGVVVVADVLFVPVAATSSGPCSGSRLHS